MNIEDEIVPKMITKYMNTFGNKKINEMTCSDTKYNFSVHIVNLYKGEERWKFDDSWRNTYDYVLVIDSEIPVPNNICDEYKEKHFKDERALKYPLLWAFDTEMIDDLKYMGVDLTSWSFGKAGLHFKNRE
jgi:hypothetical protein